MSKDQQLVDNIMSFRKKITHITNRIEYMEDIIDKTIEHNVGAKMRIQMDSFPVPLDPNRYQKKERRDYGDDDDDENKSPSQNGIDKLLGISSGFMFTGATAMNQPFKNSPSANMQEILPIDIRLDEAEVIMMVGAILNLTRQRKIILEKEYRKLVKQLKL